MTLTAPPQSLKQTLALCRVRNPKGFAASICTRTSKKNFDMNKQTFEQRVRALAAHTHQLANDVQRNAAWSPEVREVVRLLSLVNTALANTLTAEIEVGSN